MLQNQNTNYHKKGLNLAEQLKVKDRKKKTKKRKIIFTTLGIIATLIISPFAVAAYKVYNFNGNVNRSNILTKSDKLNEDLNILLMGLDSRVDQNGNPFPEEIYDALHAGTADDGGHNSNVLMFIHIPKNNSQAQVMSIPRDNYVQLTGISPEYNQYGKIKEAYGLAVAQTQNKLYGSNLSTEDTYRQARDAGRLAQIKTVENFLGNNIQINHFAEIDMAGFFQIAQAVEPIQVCLNNATKDTYSGADFQAGVQEISAEQAVAFVRQRRDYNNTVVSLTDLDRGRRQQAFVAAVLLKARDPKTYTNLNRTQKILDSVQNNLTLDNNFNIIDLGPKLIKVMSGNTAFTTLPILGFGTSAYGQSINEVNIKEVQETVRQLMYPNQLESNSQTNSNVAPNNLESNNTPQTSNVESQTNNVVANDENVVNDSQTESTDTYDDWEVPLFSNGKIPCVN